MGLRTNVVDEEYIASRPVKLGLLKKGDVALYNQQALQRRPSDALPTPFRRLFDALLRLTRGTHTHTHTHTHTPQVLHCGGANESPDRVRRQFYISARKLT